MYILNGFKENPLRDDVAYPVFKKSTSGKSIEYVVISQSTQVSGPYTGLVVASVTIKGGDSVSAIDTVVNVVDHSGCIFDETVTGFTGWAKWGVFKSLDTGAACDTLTPYHWYAINRCCATGSGLYATPCP